MSRLTAFSSGVGWEFTRLERIRVSIKRLKFSESVEAAVATAEMSARIAFASD